MRSRRTNQWLFYVDIILLGLGAVALVAVVHDAYAAGYLSATDAVGYSDYMMRVSFEAVVVVLALSYFLARFYKTRVKELANPWG